VKKRAERNLWQIGEVRIAIVSDIHGNRTAFEAVLADLRLTSPDLILHGGDLPHGGSSPAEIVDWIRDLGWQGVAGNTDEMLWAPETLTEFASGVPQLRAMFEAIEEMAAATREALGGERIAWLSRMPRTLVQGRVALVHAGRESTWRSPVQTASDEELYAEYAPLGKPAVVYGHIHSPFVRRVSGAGGEMMVANSGSVSLSYDGDRRAAYLLLDDEVSGDGEPEIRRVEYDVDKEIRAVRECGLPQADWIARTLESGLPQML
jgi:predicted phosphodiesterase